MTKAHSDASSATSSFILWLSQVSVGQDLEQILAPSAEALIGLPSQFSVTDFPSSCELFQAWKLTQTPFFFILLFAFLLVLHV